MKTLKELYPKPYTCTMLAADGDVLSTTWDCYPHHLEVETYPDGHQEWFYYNRQTKEAWEYEDSIYDIDLPDQLKRYYTLATTRPNIHYQARKITEKIRDAFSFEENA